MEYMHGGASKRVSPLLLGYSDQDRIFQNVPDIAMGPVLCHKKLICWFAGQLL